MIAVTTCTRAGGVSYLQATLASIDASARDKHKVLFVDGSAYLTDAPPGWEQRITPRPCVRAENRWPAWSAIRESVEHSEDLLLCEDDIKFCRNGVARAETVPIPDDVAFLSYFAPFGDLTMSEGIWRTSMTTFGYAQCLRLPLRTLRALIEKRWEMTDASNGTTDGVLRAMGVRRGWKYGVHYPGLVQHVGAVSAIGTAGLVGRRVSRAYPGDNFDAHSPWIQHYT